jgi:hypothetical protein
LLYDFPIFVQGSLGANESIVGVNREITLAFVKLDEQSSSLFGENLRFTNFTVPDYLTDYDDYSAWQASAYFQCISICPSFD